MMRFFWPLLFLSLCFPAPLVSNTVLYVKPTQDTRCPGKPCHTLDEYNANSTQYIVSDTTMRFLPGNHNLSNPLSVSGINNIILMSTNQSSVTEISVASIVSFSNVSHLAFVNLKLIVAEVRTVVNIENVFNLNMSETSILGTGSVLMLTNAMGNSLFSEVEITGGTQFKYTDNIEQFP